MDYCKRNGIKNPVNYWIESAKDNKKQEYDEKNKDKRIAELKKANTPCKQRFADLHDTFDDANLMYHFMADYLCNSHEDITIMSSE